MRVAMIAEVIPAVHPLPQYFSARNLADVLDPYLYDKACGCHIMSAERCQNCTINRFRLNGVYLPCSRNVGRRDRKVVKSNRHRVLLSDCTQATNYGYQKCAHDTARNQNAYCRLQSSNGTT